MLDDGEIGGPFINYTSATFALSRDIGIIQATQDPIVWVVGFTADPVVDYADLSGASQLRSLYYKTKYVDESLESLVGVHIYQRTLHLISFLRLLTFSMISLMPLQEPSNWTRRYSRTLLLSLDYSEIWCPLQLYKYTAALS